MKISIDMAKEILPNMREDELEHILSQFEWHKVYVLFPRKTIDGKRVRGHCYTKLTDTDGGMQYVYVATEKDVFKNILGERQ